MVNLLNNKKRLKWSKGEESQKILNWSKVFKHTYQTDSKRSRNVLSHKVCQGLKRHSVTCEAQNSSNEIHNFIYIYIYNCN